ncbi:hypothetical protein K3152_04945 [Qipengyuania sp. 1NDH17]|uniref:Uncharacterized protein n=1 Tax=Qipengyuania polymorpha TaxID=2867234 RepID=A0ABS7IWA2_9SPHN|nr:hypothetical protein [Qipengyuania polymorpha]MBX7457588.1 hypothetical protein [Qipengyuania polymorpha]
MELIDLLFRMPKLDILLLAVIAGLVSEMLVRQTVRRKRLRIATLLLTILGLALWQFHPLWTAGMDNAEAGYFLIYSSVRFGFGLFALAVSWLAWYFLIPHRKAA